MTEEIVKPKLTMMQTLFVAEYVKDWNATQAAIRAGYSETSAAESGSENLRNSYIKELIQLKVDAINATAHIDAVWALQKRLELIDRFMLLEPGAVNTALQAIEKSYLGMSEKTESKSENVNYNATFEMTEADRDMLRRWRGE